MMNFYLILSIIALLLGVQSNFFPVPRSNFVGYHSLPFRSSPNFAYNRDHANHFLDFNYNKNYAKNVPFTKYHGSLGTRGYTPLPLPDYWKNIQQPTYAKKRNLVKEKNRIYSHVNSEKNVLPLLKNIFPKKKNLVQEKNRIYSHVDSEKNVLPLSKNISLHEQTNKRTNEPRMDESIYPEKNVLPLSKNISLNEQTNKRTNEPRMEESIYPDKNEVWWGTSSGLKYSILKKGFGKEPTYDDIVTVTYIGYTPEGHVFDDQHVSETIDFPVKNLISGVSHALLYMKEGGMYKIWVPSELAYGEKGIPGVIKPNQPLMFTYVLHAISKK